MMLEEIWKDIPNEEGYSVSNLGRVRSNERYVDNSRYGKQKIRERILKQQVNTSGYCELRLNLHSHLVHRLVCSAFYGISDLHVDHLNSIKTDNRLENLEYVTKRENSSRHKLKWKSTDLPTGVFEKGKGRFIAHIYFDGERINLGVFDSAEEADARYKYALSSIEEGKGKEWIIEHCVTRAKRKINLPTHISMSRDKYRVCLYRNGKKISFGNYSIIEDAMRVIESEQFKLAL